MPSTIITLKEASPGKWILVSQKGHTISSIFRGTKEEAIVWARAFCSTWSDWVVKLEEKKDEKST